MDGGAWKAAVHGVAKSRTRLSNFPFTFHFHALEKEMATHSSVLAWRIPGTGKPGGLPSMGSHRVGHDWSDLAAAAAEAEQLYLPSYPNQRGLVSERYFQVIISIFKPESLLYFVRLYKYLSQYNFYPTTDSVPNSSLFLSPTSTKLWNSSHQDSEEI